jgi:transposase
MPFPRKRTALQFTELERHKLESIRKSRTEEKRRTVRAAILLDSLSGQSDEVIARRHHVSRGTVVLCIKKCLQLGLDAALGELPRPGKPRQLPDDAIAWVRNCACQKPKQLGYSYELWTYQLLTAHVRRHCAAAGHPALHVCPMDPDFLLPSIWLLSWPGIRLAPSRDEDPASNSGGCRRETSDPCHPPSGRESRRSARRSISDQGRLH